MAKEEGCYFHIKLLEAKEKSFKVLSRIGDLRTNYLSTRHRTKLFNHEFLDMFFYTKLKFQVNWSSTRHRDTDKKMQYRFCYLLPFNLWTSNL